MIATMTPPAVSDVARTSLIPAGPELWRVLDGERRVIGHVRRVAEGPDERFRALRYHPTRRNLIPVGDFWSADEAVKCLAFSR